MESMAEYYSAELSQKIKRGIAISASKCKYFGGSVPLGYKVDEQKNFVVNEETAPLVKTIFEMFVGGRTYADIIRFLNERGIKTSQGGLWNKSSFHRIFSNRRYLGKYIYHGEEIDGGMPQLIDDELFAEAQKVLAKYAAAPSRGKAKVEYLLSDNVICANGQHKILKAAELNVDQSRNPISDYGFPINLFFIINLQSISAFTCNKRAKCATLFAIVKHGLFS